jgi:hypothetical protein
LTPISALTQWVDSLDWPLDLRTGAGRFKYANGDEYVGSVLDGKRHGQGEGNGSGSLTFFVFIAITVVTASFVIAQYCNCDCVLRANHSFLPKNGSRSELESATVLVA